MPRFPIKSSVDRYLPAVIAALVLIGVASWASLLVPFNSPSSDTDTPRSAETTVPPSPFRRSKGGTDRWHAFWTAKKNPSRSTTFPLPLYRTRYNKNSLTVSPSQARSHSSLFWKIFPLNFCFALDISTRYGILLVNDIHILVGCLCNRS